MQLENETDPGALPIALREMTAADEGFVYAYWTHCYRAKRRVPTEATRATIDKILKRGGRVLIACDPGNPSFCYGFICWEPALLHFVFVLKTYRTQGVAAKLFWETGLASSSQVQCTHWTPDANRVAARYPQFVRFNPEMMQ